MNYKDKIDIINEKIQTHIINIENQKVETKHFSKTIQKPITKSEKYIMDLGTKLHYIFETYDFKNQTNQNLTKEEQTYITNFLSHPETSNIKDAKIYKEYEIMYEKDSTLYHGIIDLLLEYDTHFDIIDYKLSNVESDAYISQLNGYKTYIENRFKKRANIYLYSIQTNTLKKIN